MSITTIPLAMLHALMLSSIIRSVVFLVLRDLPMYSSNVIIAGGTLFLIHSFYKREEQEKQKKQK